jgi:hypothetical protein
MGTISHHLVASSGDIEEAPPPLSEGRGARRHPHPLADMLACRLPTSPSLRLRKLSRGRGGRSAQPREVENWTRGVPPAYCRARHSRVGSSSGSGVSCAGRSASGT